MEEKRDVKEKRKILRCTNCSTPLVCMNKYSILKNERKIYIWYVCPRRREWGEKGCGHRTPIELERLEKV